MNYQPRNAHPHDCPDHRTCARCQDEDAGERAAIQTEGQPADAWERAKAEILRSRQPGQRALGLR